MRYFHQDPLYFLLFPCITRWQTCFIGVLRGGISCSFRVLLGWGWSESCQERGAGFITSPAGSDSSRLPTKPAPLSKGNSRLLLLTICSSKSALVSESDSALTPSADQVVSVSLRERTERCSSFFRANFPRLSRCIRAISMYYIDSLAPCYWLVNRVLLGRKWQVYPTALLAPEPSCFPRNTRQKPLCQTRRACCAYKLGACN